MDEAKCFDCLDWCGCCVSAKTDKRQRIGRIASGDACEKFRAKKRAGEVQEVHA